MIDAGKLNSKISIKRLVKVSDSFGGFNSTTSEIATVWCNLKEISGEINEKFGKREQDVQIEIIMRKNTADLIQIGDIFTIEGGTQKYRINEKFELNLDFYVKLKATKTE